MAFETFEPLGRSTATSRIADVIRSSILDGSLAQGEQLTETQLAERLDVSRGPVREAMQRLVQEGLLWTKPHHGTFVVEIGRDDVADIYLARRAVEGAAATRLIGTADKSAVLKALDAAVANLRAAVRSGDWPAIVSADIAFHELLVDSARSQRLTRMFRTLTAETRLCINTFVDAHPEWIKRAVPEHRELVAALRQGDNVAALECIDAHLSLDEHHHYRGAIRADAAPAS